MRIDLMNSAASQLANDASAQPLNGQNAAASQTQASEDRTTLTSDQASVQQLVNTAMQSPEIRQDKVTALQQAVSSGQYELDPAKIAASMIDERA